MSELPPPGNEPNEGALMHRWLDNQRQELQLQGERIALSNKELEHNRALSEKTIDAQLKDRGDERAYSQSIAKHILIFFGIITLMLLLFGAYVVQAGKEAFLSEIIGLVIELGKYLIGAATGFFIAKSKYHSGNEKNSSDE